jgi:DNA-binding transcriptional MerR regulator
MAYYNSACIERIRFIRTIQSKYAFPLSKIKLLLAKKDEGVDVAPILELNETVFKNSEGPCLDKGAFYVATGLTPGQGKALMGDGLLLPLEKGRFNEQDVTIGRIYAQGLALGIKVSDMTLYAVTAKQIVDEEMLLRRRFTAHLPDDQDAEITRKLVQAARATRNYVIDRTFQKRIAAAGNLKDERLL